MTVDPTFAIQTVSHTSLKITRIFDQFSSSNEKQEIRSNHSSKISYHTNTMMMKLLTVIFTLVVAAASPPDHVAGNNIPKTPYCLSVYPRPLSKGLIALGLNFTGVKFGPDLIHINDPLYGTYAEAAAIGTGGKPIGRVLGFFSEVTGSGPVALEFFKTESWLALLNGGGVNGVPDIILGGTGCFLGAFGTIKRTTLDNGNVYLYRLCMRDPLPCSP